MDHQGKKQNLDKWLDRAMWLPHPERPREPLGPADWFGVAAGYLELPCGIACPAPQKGPMLTDELCPRLFTLVANESLRDQIRHMVRCYPASDRERRDRFAASLLGTTRDDSGQIEAELYDLSEIVRVLRGLNARDFGPAELYAELSSDRR